MVISEVKDECKWALSLIGQFLATNNSRKSKTTNDSKMKRESGPQP